MDRGSEWIHGRPPKVKGKIALPRPETLAKIAAVLEVPVDALLFDVVCMRELLRIVGVSARDVAGDPAPQGKLERAAAELAEELGTERVEAAIVALRGLLGVLSSKGGPREK